MQYIDHVYTTKRIVPSFEKIILKRDIKLPTYIYVYTVQLL